MHSPMMYAIFYANPRRNVFSAVWFDRKQTTQVFWTSYYEFLIYVVLNRQTRMLSLLRCRKPKCRASVKIAVFIFLSVLLFLHFVVLPAFSGGYHDECFLPDEKRRILRIMVQNISQAFDKFNVKYWLDYGEFGARAWN